MHIGLRISVVHASKSESTGGEEEGGGEESGPPQRQISVTKETPAEPKGDELVCPVEGGIFGKSNDEFTECNECDIYRACARKALGK